MNDQFAVDEQVVVGGQSFFVTEHKRGSNCVYLRRTLDAAGSTAYAFHQVSRAAVEAKPEFESLGTAIARVQKEAKRILCTA